MEPFYFPLKDRREVAQDTIEFIFDTSGSTFNFTAGQYVNIGLIDPPITDQRGNSRSMSICSSPNSVGYFATAMRIRPSAYKTNLKTMPLGTKVKVLGPFGHFTLKEDLTRPIVFLAGGIGITPMRSIIEYVTQEQLSQRIFLFYSNRNPESSAFIKDFENWEKENPNFTLIATITDSTDKNWIHKYGRIDQNLLSRYLKNLNEPFYYIAGPAVMVQGMVEMLRSLEVPSENLVTEQFGGY
ncbi:MAG: hypothetical protein A3J50_01645 [Candidatus Woykebacteria bacterium RIFCSPHIGHO2_02_FULL_43_16b]|uniref:FAD-binding FR-type domain-containing protein n=2 Tax=Candidatus Woykeibacteriota TaxID=1817899 RepID=A0A1G1WL95_9BACT|nr:MAG: hypothetical protein A3J50_01645 [Candidatus Woykebacteria bacterium RIFCSPHIGHO2_02_FULL_43_16b]